MNDIILEFSRLIPIIIIFIYLLIYGKKLKNEKENGWRFIIVGFGLILFGSAIDITDNFESLNKFVVVGDTEFEAFLEKVVGYLGGFILLAMGFWKWLPKVARLNQTQQELEASNKELEVKVRARTKELNLKNKELESTLEDFYTLRINMQNDSGKKQMEKENEKIRNRLDELKKLKSNI